MRRITTELNNLSVTPNQRLSGYSAHDLARFKIENPLLDLRTDEHGQLVVYDRLTAEQKLKQLVLAAGMELRKSS